MDLTDALDQIGAVQRGLSSLEHRESRRVP